MGEGPIPASHTPVLLLGASGMLGRAWRCRLAEGNIAHDAPTSRELDLRDAQAIERIDGRYRLVINCAGWTDVDGAEEDEVSARGLNADAPALLARRCAETGALLVHYSTDYVFDGRAIHPYGVDHRIAPVNAYGRTKAEGERAVIGSGAPCLVVRTSWLYAPWGRNFVLSMLRLFRTRAEVRVVDDQTGRPTSCEHLAAATCAIISRGGEGVWHVTGGGQCSWFDFAQEIARLTRTDCRVHPCASEDFARPAPRPPYSVLDLSLTERLIGPMPDWRVGLPGVLARAEEMSGARVA